MTEGILNTFITSATTIIVALIGAGLFKLNSRVKRVQNQVENDHSTNLREELDKRHAETRGWFDQINRRLVNGDERMGRIESIVYRHDREIEAVEDTITKEKKQ